jgi:hypothetical protein
MGIKENIKLADIVVKHGITVDQIKQLKSAMLRTWEVIQYDLIQCFEGGSDEMYSVFDDEASMIAENTLDAGHVTTYCPDMDLKFVYNQYDGTRRLNCIEMGEDILRSSLL